LGDKAKVAFGQLIDEKKLLFLLFKDEGYYYIPSRMTVRGGNMLHHGTNTQVVQKSLFDHVPEDDFNEEEKAVALFLDNQGELLEWWSRNGVGGKNYYIKGWQPRKFYPDFFTGKKHPEDDSLVGEVFVLEYKGKHLKDNEDTVYKRELLEFCNRDTWEHLSEGFPGKKFTFQMIYQDEYEQVISSVFQ
jgi:type III restriction enzyme